MFRLSNRNQHIALALVVIGTFAGCSKKDGETTKGQAAPLTKEGAAVPAKQPLTAAWFGKAVGPPGLLAKVKFGSSHDEAVKAAGADSSGDLPEAEFEGVRYGVSKSLENIVTESNIWLPQAKKPLLVEAWGEGNEMISGGGEKITVWFNPETGIRAVYSNQSKGDDAYLRFKPYLPLAKLLGEGKQIAALAKPLIGLTPEEAAKGYPEYADKKNFRISLPPTEWELGSTTNVISYERTGKIESVSFKISYQGRPEAKDEILAAIKAKWGEPKGVGKISKATIYNEADPHIEVDENCSICKQEIQIQLGN